MTNKYLLYILRIGNQNKNWQKKWELGVMGRCWAEKKEF